MEKCYFNGVCTKVPCDGMLCVRYLEFQTLLNLSNIPKAYIPYRELSVPPVDEEAFEKLAGIQKNIIQFVESGGSLYLWSRNCGNGKTTVATKLLKSYFGAVWAGNGFRRRGYFTHIPTFLQRLKDNISEKNGIEDIKQIMRNVDCLVCDDIAVKAVSEFEGEVLLSLIDDRLANKRATIYTSNSSGEALEAVWGKRMASRVYNASQVIKFKGIDMRGKND